MSQSNLSVPCVGERERRIESVHVFVQRAGQYIEDGRYNLAADKLEAAARVLRGIPTQGET